ncbi:MAG TPA: AgmX/PglI C-terminal domain-containing protein [Polyangia bacterium]|jgi:TonB family protein
MVSAPVLVASALASAVVTWGVPASFRPLVSVFGSKVEGDRSKEISKEIIHRIVRRHFDEVKACYDQELSRQPALAGRIDVQFTIAPSGQISEASVRQSTLGNAYVESCIVAALRRWEFPKPLDHHPVIVSYPFILSPPDPK